MATKHSRYETQQYQPILESYNTEQKRGTLRLVTQDASLHSR